MPELPEVETVRRTLEPRLKGRRVLALQTLWPGSFVASKAVKDLLPDCFGSLQIIKVARRGKVLLLHLTSESSDPKNNPAASAPKTDLFMAFHLKMTGQVLVKPLDAKPDTHTRLIFRLDNALLFFDDIRKFGYCRLMLPEELENWSFWQKLGPEPFDLDGQTFAARFMVPGKAQKSKPGKAQKSKPGNAQKLKQGKIKNLLLDQTIIAGVGNIYADEALFRAGIRPDASAADLSPAEFATLHHFVVEVLQEGIEAKGSSIRNYRDANGQSGGFQDKFKVYGRRGQPCIQCQSLLEHTKLAGRSTVFCMKCQK